MIRGPLMFILGYGQSFHAQGIYLRLGKATLRLLLVKLCIYLGDEGLMGVILVILLHSIFPVGPDVFIEVFFSTMLTVMILVDRWWYRFKNMGPTPKARSGHAMVSMGSKIILVGGESAPPSPPEDPTIIHVLDTSLLVSL